MNIIETKYEVGHKFFCPRIYKKYHKESVVIDGIEYFRDYCTYEPVVKERIVIAILIEDNDISYKVKEKGEFTMPRWVYEDDLELSIFTYEQAMYIISKQPQDQEFFGLK